MLGIGCLPNMLARCLKQRYRLHSGCSLSSSPGQTAAWPDEIHPSRSVFPVSTSPLSGQLPQPGQIFLDHVAWMVRDIAAASAVFERLGFPLTPYSVHGDRDPATGALKPVGTANRLAMLSKGYIEILTTVDGVDSPDTRHFHSSVGHHTGVHLLAFTVADPATETKRIKARGMADRHA